MGEWQTNDELRALAAASTLPFDCAAVHLRKPANERQSRAQAACRGTRTRFDLNERFEHLPLVAWLEADPGIGYGYDRVITG